MQPPCSLEFEAVKRKQIMRVRVITDLVTKAAVTARLDSASVMNEWVQEIGAKVGMKDTYVSPIIASTLFCLNCVSSALPAAPPVWLRCDPTLSFSLTICILPALTI